MHRPVVIGSAVLVFSVSALFLSGCGGSAKKTAKAPKVKATIPVSQRFTPQATDAYEVAITVTKDFKFEQPALGKLRQEETTTQVRMTCDQTIDKINENGWAEATITIRGLACRMVKQNEVQVDYDSSRDSDKQNPLQKLIGQSYKIRLSPDGKAEVADISTLQVNDIPGLEGRLAKRIATEEEIIKRHEVLALPDSPAAVAAGSSWERIVPSPPGLLSSKSFRKNYTLINVDEKEGAKLATVTMTAGESSVPADSQAAAGGGLGIFAKMLDNEDEYTGKMVLDLNSGKVQEYNETLISSYIAQEANPKATPEQGPDTLVIRFIQKVERKSVN